MIPYWIVFLILLVADVSVGWMISESPMPLLLVAVGMSIFGGFRLFGRGVAAYALPFIVGAIFVATLWLFEQRMARVMLSDLPILFHLGVALHFWLWGSRTPRFWLAMAAGALIFWTTGTTEIYGNSKLLVRSLAALGLVLPIGCFLQKPATKTLVAAVAGAIFLGSLVAPMDWFSGRLYEWTKRNRTEDFLNGWGANANAVTLKKGALDGSSRELPKRADLELDDEIRAHLQVSNRSDFARLMQQPVYLKTSSLAVFETVSRLSPDRRARWIFDSDDGVADGRTFIEQEPESAVEFSVLIDRDLISTLPLVPGTARVDVDSVYEFANGWWQIEPKGEQPLIRFNAAVPQAALDSINLADHSLRAGVIDKFPFRTPPFSGLSLKISDLAVTIMNPEKPLAEQLSALEAFFESETKYSLSYRNTKSLNPLDNFLFEEKRGHCELFASATVLMLRHSGIPSRVSYGFLGGEYDLENRLITFRDRDYHAWAEVFVEGRGWQIFDTTPESAGRIAPPQSSSEHKSAAVDLTAYEDIGVAELIFKNERSAFEKALDATLLFLSQNFILLLGFIAAAVWIWSVLSKKNRNQSNGTLRPSQTLRDGSQFGELPRFVADLLGIGNHLDHPKQASQTWREFLNSLKSAGHCNGEFDAMVDYLYAIRYCSSERDRGLEQEFSEQARAFRKREF